MNKRIKLLVRSSLLVLIAFYFNQAAALTFPLPAHGDSVVGHVFTATSKVGDDFDKIAERYDVGFLELVEANPTLKPYDLAPNSKVIIPARFILPYPRKDLVINLSEFRIYFYPPHSHQVITYPIGIGEAGYSTPIGNYYIAGKEPNPVWIATKNVRWKIFDEQGIVVPEKVTAGPQNPLGDYAMHLNIWTTLIHGTNEPYSVGKRSSAGCIHLYPEDIAAVFNKIPMRTPVHIINTIYKAGWSKGSLYLQAVQPLSEQINLAKSDITPMVKIVTAAVGKQHVKVNWAQATKVALKKNDIPTIIAQTADAKKLSRAQLAKGIAVN